MKTFLTNAPKGTIEAAYRDTFRPKLSAIRQRECDLTISRFFFYRTDYTPIGELCDQLADAYVEWLKAEFDLGGFHLEKQGKNIRSIIRAIDPAKVRPKGLPGDRSEGYKKRPKQPKPAEPPAEPGTVRHFFETVYKLRRLQGKSANTLRLYRNTFNNFRAYLGHEPLLADLTDDNLAGFIGWHLSRARSPETCNKDAGQLMAVARYAAKKRFIDAEPEITLLTPPKRSPMAWLKEDLAKLFSAAEKEQGRVAGHAAADWWKALLLTCYFTGERIGALMALQWHHVNLDTSWMIVPAELRKGKRCDKVFQLPPVCVEALRKLQTGASDVVFPWKLNPSMIYRRFERILKVAGLPTDRKSKFHRMRKTAASWFKANGGDPTQLLDHADPKTTAKYIDPRICTTKSTADLLDDPTSFGGEGVGQ